MCGFCLKETFLPQQKEIVSTISFPGKFVPSLMKSTNTLWTEWATASSHSVPVLSSVIDKESGCALEAYSHCTNIWKSFPTRVDSEHTRQAGPCNISPVSAVAASDGQIMRALLWVKVFMCLCDHRYVLFCHWFLACSADSAQGRDGAECWVGMKITSSRTMMTFFSPIHCSNMLMCFH